VYFFVPVPLFPLFHISRQLGKWGAITRPIWPAAPPSLSITSIIFGTISEGITSSLSSSRLGDRMEESSQGFDRPILRNDGFKSSSPYHAYFYHLRKFLLIGEIYIALPNEHRLGVLG
jgi:hypothetical protein